MRKLTREQNNFIDDSILTYIVEPLTHGAYKYGIKPNQLTYMGLVSAFIGIYYLTEHQLLPFIVFFSLSHVFDTWDGHLARTYKLTSTFGEYFDHISDTVKTVALFYVLWIYYNLKNNKLIIIGTIVFLVLLQTFVGCQERISKHNKHSTTLSLQTLLCYKTPVENIKILKYFGPGSFILFCLVITTYLFYFHPLESG